MQVFRFTASCIPASAPGCHGSAEGCLPAASSTPAATTAAAATALLLHPAATAAHAATASCSTTTACMMIFLWFKCFPNVLLKFTFSFNQVYQQPVHQVIVQQQPQAVQQPQPQPQPRGAVPAQRFQQQQAPPQQQQYRGPQPQQQQGQQVVRLQNASPVIFGRVQGSVGGQRQIIRTPAGQIVRVQNQQNLLLNDGIQQTMTPQTWIPIHKPHNMVYYIIYIFYININQYCLGVRLSKEAKFIYLYH